jgi:DNA polymerase-3 subunit beta
MTATAERTTTTVTISRTALRVALGKLLAAVDTTSKALPVAQHILIEAADNRLTMTATNFEVFARLRVSCECEGAGRVLLPAKLLADIVASLPPAPVTLTLAAPRATIAAGRSRFELTGLPPADFPQFDEAKGAVAIEVIAATFLDALQRAVAHTSDAQSRPSLNGVLVEREGAQLQVVGCDGHTMARLPGGTFTDGEGLSRECLMHRSSVPVLSRLFGDLEADEPIRITLDEGRMQVASADGVAQIRLVEHQYPNYRQTITQARKHVVVCDRALFASALKRVALTTGEVGRVSITLDDEMSIAVPKGDKGSATDVVPLDRHDRESDHSIAFDVNAALMGRALATLTTDSIELRVESPDRALFLRGAEQADTDPTLVLVMPLRKLD